MEFEIWLASTIPKLLQWVEDEDVIIYHHHNNGSVSTMKSQSPRCIILDDDA